MCAVLEADGIIVFTMKSVIDLHTPPFGDVPGNTSVSEVFQQCRRFQFSDLQVLKGRLLDERHRLMRFCDWQLHLLGYIFSLSDEVAGIA